MSNSTHDSSETRERLLSAGADVFVERGFRHATVREICRRAEANIAAVNYHFRDKLGLYTAVLQSTFEAALTRFPPDMGLPADAPPEARLRAFVHSFLLRLLSPQSHSRLPLLMVREMADPSPALDMICERFAKPMAALLNSILAQLAPQLSPDQRVLCCGSIVGQIFFHRQGQPMIRRIYPDLQYTPQQIEALAEHLTRFTLAAIRHYGDATEPSLTLGPSPSNRSTDPPINPPPTP